MWFTCKTIYIFVSVFNVRLEKLTGFHWKGNKTFDKFCASWKISWLPNLTACKGPYFLLNVDGCQWIFILRSQIMSRAEMFSVKKIFHHNYTKNICLFSWSPEYLRTCTKTIRAFYIVWVPVTYLLQRWVFLSEN